jgi:hypothetical protein
VRVAADRLETYDVSGADPHLTGSVPLPGLSGGRLLLAGDRIVVIGDVAGAVRPDWPTGQLLQRTAVRTFDVSDPAHPRLVDSRVYDGRLVIARQSGDTVRLVLTAALPALDFVAPGASRTSEQALAANRAVVRASTIGDWLPTAGTDGGGRRPLLDCSQVAVPDTDGGLGTLTVVGFSAAAPADVSATAVATGSTIAYLSPGHLYVATMPRVSVWGCCLPHAQPDRAPDVSPGAPARATTQLYAFDLSGTSATFVGAASVSGRVSDGWSLDEYDGVLRVALGPSLVGGTSSVMTLRPEAGHLVEVGRLDALGLPGDQIRSVRWFDGLAVLVTYRQLDPLYAIDLTDPAAPRVLGALELPGYSSYLHPVGDHLVLGLGQTGGGPVPLPPLPVPSPPPATASPGPIRRDPPLPHTLPPTLPPTLPSIGGPGATPTIPAEPIESDRARATLFDLSDPSHPAALDTVSFPQGSTVMAGPEPHQVTWLPDRDTLLTVVSAGYTGPEAWVAELRVVDGGLRHRLIDIGPLPDPGAVRTVPLADGRVVLVTGDVVRFLAL